MDFSRNELKGILTEAECCYTCGHGWYSDGVFKYCDLVRTKDKKRHPCYPISRWQVCEHWINRRTYKKPIDIY